MALALAVHPFADVRPSIGIALQAFTFERCQAADNVLRVGCHNRALLESTLAASLVITCIKRVGDIFAAYTHSVHLITSGSHPSSKCWRYAVCNYRVFGACHFYAGRLCYCMPINGVERKTHIIIAPSSAVAVCVSVNDISLEADCRSSASLSIGGNSLPRRSAPRRIPSQAFALK